MTTWEVFAILTVSCFEIIPHHRNTIIIKETIQNCLVNDIDM